MPAMRIPVSAYYPELYEAYAEAKNINVVFEKLPENVLAGYQPITNTIYITNGTT